MPRIELEQLNCAFARPGGGWLRAVDDVHLTVGDGECLALVGPSGSGKTTLLRLIAGLEVPTSGTIRFDGTPVQGVPPAARDVGFVFQNPAVYPHLTVRENLGISLELRTGRRPETARGVEALAQQLGLTPLLAACPETLSGGERQRVALGRVLATRPSILLLDEPLASLDVPLRRQLREVILQWRAEQGVTTLYVTHDQQEALALGGRAAVFHQGRLEQVGGAEALYDQPASLFIAGFIGSVPMNCLNGRWHRNGTEGSFEPDAPFGAGTWALTPEWAAAAPAVAQPVVLGLRSEHWRVSVDSEPPGPRLAAEITRVEFAETHLLLCARAGGQVLRVVVPRGASWSPGQRVELRPDLARAVWFDAATGRRVDAHPSRR